MLSIGAVVLSAIGVQPASASWMVAPPPNRPKDFAFIKKDGVYHLFYIRHNTTLPSAQTEIDLGHATSYDLYNWTQQPPVLPIRPTSWDSEHVWAPSIVESCGVYTLFYCGVSNEPGVYNSFQRIGIATSTDLFDWSRLDQPVFACDQVPWVICDPLNPDLTGFRDAFVMPDPALPGGWLMLYTTVSAIDYGNSQIGMATSNGSLSSWTDAGALGISSRTITNSSTAESPHMFEHDGLWFLFFTINGARPLAFATTPDPRADVSEWTWHGALDDMLGVGTNSWYASEYLRDGTHRVLLLRQYRPHRGQSHAVVGAGSVHARSPGLVPRREPGLVVRLVGGWAARAAARSTP